jgi:hypothetical protein
MIVKRLYKKIWGNNNIKRCYNKKIAGDIAIGGFNYLERL